MTSSIAYIVDGDLEKRFLEKCCGGGAIRKVGNGDRCPAGVIAKQAASHIRVLNNRYKHIVIIVDLEDRKTTPAQFALEIEESLVAEGIQNQGVKVFIKEKEAEDWILADPMAIAEYVGSPVDTAGLRGKSGLSKVLRVHDIKYNEVTTGSDLLKGIWCSRARVNSPTLAYLIQNMPVSCWWTTR